MDKSKVTRFYGPRCRVFQTADCENLVILARTVFD